LDGDVAVRCRRMRLGEGQFRARSPARFGSGPASRSSASDSTVHHLHHQERRTIAQRPEVVDTQRARS
jgi:hypothetical protein